MLKIALITHSYHNFTKSGQIYANEIFVDKRKYKIDYFFNEEWQGNPNFKTFNQNIDGYDIVLIVQLLSKSLLQNINCKNIIFIPMYDHSRNWGIKEWRLTQNLKILSPSHGIHKILTKYGLNSLRIKYYPEADKYLEQNFSNIFFWNRVQSLEYPIVLKLFKNYNFSNLNIHKNHDPNHNPLQPSIKEIKKYNITFSKWFQQREDYLNFLDNFGFYIAPRPFEGDGAAFIDSMKKGKIVISPDNHPYRDYIKNNINGFLYSLLNPQPINFNDIDLNEISKNAHNSVLSGRKDWINSLPEIHDYIFNGKTAGDNYYFKFRKKFYSIKNYLK